MQQPRESRYPVSFLLATLVLVLLLVPVRVGGAAGELPAQVDPDEAIFAEPGIRMALGNLMPPRLFGHPGSLTIIAVALADRALYVWGVSQRWWSGLTEFADALRRDSSVLLLVGRQLSGLVGIWTVAALVLLLRRLGLDGPTSVGGGVLCALSVLHLQLSWLVRPDMYQGLMAVLTAHAAIGMAQRGATRDYLMVGACAGLAGACRYPGIMALALVPVAHALTSRVHRESVDAAGTEARNRRITALLLVGAGMISIAAGATWRHVWLEEPPFDSMPPSWRDGDVFLRRQMRLAGAGLILCAPIAVARGRASQVLLGILWDRRPYAALGAAAAAFLAVTPDFLVRFDRAVQGIVWAAKSDHPHALGQPGLGNLLWYAGALATDLGVPVLVLALACLLKVLVSGPLSCRVVSALPLAYLAFMSLGMTRYARYLIPVVPFVAGAAAASLGALATLATRGGRPWRGLALAVAIVLVGAAPAMRLRNAVARRALQNTQVAATAWLLEHAPAGSRILTEEQTTLSMLGTRFRVRETFSMADDAKVAEPGRYDYVVTSGPVEGESYRERLRAQLTSTRPLAARFDGSGPLWRGLDVFIYAPPRQGKSGLAEQPAPGEEKATSARSGSRRD